MKAPKEGAHLTRVLGVDEHRVVGLWQKGSTTWAVVYEVDSGKALAHASSQDGSDLSTLRSTGNLIAVGPLLLDTATGKGRDATGTTPKAATADRIYSTDDQQHTHVLTAGSDTVIGGDDVALPLGVAGGRALVLADKLGQRTLYALTPGPGGQPAPSASGQVDQPQPPQPQE